MNKKELKKYFFSGLFMSMAIAIYFMIVFIIVYVGIDYLTSNIKFNTPANHVTLTNVVVDDKHVDSVWMFKN